MELVSSQIDREYLSEISGGDLEFEQELVQTFLDAAPGLISAYKNGSDASDLIAVSHAAHTLKGSSRSIGANKFAEVTEEAEKAAREGNIEICRALYADIEAAYQLLAAASSVFLQAA